MPRDNNNALLAYTTKSGSFGVGCKVRGLGYRWEVVATESHAKRHRAMYPHQLAIANFTLTVELNGYTEQRNFLNFLKTYSETLIYGNAQPMWVMVNSRNFARFGFPTKGMTEQEHVGSMVFTPSITFEAITDPLDNTMFVPTSQNVSQWDLSGTETDVKNFFYPFSRASYDTMVRPENYYDLDTNRSPSAIDTVSNGGAGQLSEAVTGAQDAIDRLSSGGLR